MSMKIPSHQISAFLEVVKTKSFSKAAGNLAVTQSALSQRISNLESDLETTLFIRESSGLYLTSEGEVFLRYCQAVSSLEEETLGALKKETKGFSGTIRIAGFSSVMRSMIIPSLAPFLRGNPDVNCEFESYEMADLPEVLKSAKADIIILDHHLNKKGIVEHVIGKEEYVVIESAKFQSPKDVYLDHGPHDSATETFFDLQGGSVKPYRRTYMGDVYGIIDGVEQGLGRAVMSKHLLLENKKVKLVTGFKKHHKDITLNYYERPFYSKLHQKVVEEIEGMAGEFFH